MKCRGMAALAASMALLASGCTRVALGIANGGLAPPDASATYTPGLALDVYRPPDAHNAPVVVFFYGGSWTSGARA
ncbi:MAG TPA: alpha/beta hydrolase, partial [Thermomonas sp.]|nr:alpha/beta hydrolase [Thermomonas sp.]